MVPSKNAFMMAGPLYTNTSLKLSPKFDCISLKPVDIVGSENYKRNHLRSGIKFPPGKSVLPDKVCLRYLKIHMYKFENISILQQPKILLKGCIYVLNG